jgi:putative membrane protein
VTAPPDKEGKTMPFDYLPLMLVNMAAGLVILVCFFLAGLCKPGEKAWAPALGMVGLVAVVAGFHMIFTYPLPKLEEVNLQWADAAYGESTVLLGIVFLGAAAAAARGLSLVPVTIFGAIAGGIAILLGVRIIGLHLSKAPEMTGTGFILTGLAGPAALWVALTPQRLLPKIVAAVLLLPAAALWLLTAGIGYWGHLKALST